MSREPEAPSPEPSVARTHELAEGVRRGDSGAFSALYERVVPFLYVWASVRLHGGTSGSFDAQDLVQEVWLRAVSRFASFDPERGAFRGWILGIARNVLLEHYRRSTLATARGARDGDGRSESMLGSIPDSVTSVRARLARDESLQGFLEYAGGLEDVDRKILLLCCFEDHTCAEAAVRVGLSAEATTKRWQRLRARLAESAHVQRLIAES